MAYPDLYNDEHIVLEAQNVKVKSVSFTVVLTNRRLILIDSRRQAIPPQEILLATLKNVDLGENAIRDPTITLSIITTAGTTRQMILTFSNKVPGERKRESDTWVKTLRQNLSRTIEHPVLPDIQAIDETFPAADVNAIPPASPPPRIEVVNTPQQKKRIEISRPVKTIVETKPAMPKPVETTTLPVGSFCNRCGSRVPPESAFCNRCGTPVVRESDLPSAQAVQAKPEPVPSVNEPPAPAVPATWEPKHPGGETPLPTSDVTTSPAPPFVTPIPPAGTSQRPIEEVIHSIEPLIEDSVPRTPVERPVLKQPRVAASEPSEVVPEPSQGISGVQWPIITPAPGSPAPDILKSDNQSPLSPPPMPSEQRASRGIIPHAIIAIVIIIAIAGVILIFNPLGLMNGENAGPSPVDTLTVAPTAILSPTTVVTTVAPAPEETILPVTTQSPAIPPTGVWIRIIYANEFSGSVGTPGSLREISDTGERFYVISTSTGTAVANIQKDDGSADLLTVELYKDGELVTAKSTSAPKGIVEIQTSLKPSSTPTPVPTTVEPLEQEIHADAPADAIATNSTATG